MTNEMIILNAALELAEAGKIKYTGRKVKAINGAGEEIELPETEPIHTFQYWKACGFSVRKGEHAVARITIWKYAPTKEEKEAAKRGEITVEKAGNMFLKESCFFSLSQVEKR